VLRAAAIATVADAATSTYDMQQHWIAPGLADTGEPRLLIRAIFEDAVTAGIVRTGAVRFEMPDRGPVRWKWYLTFMPPYLCALA
jgi:hypothetical protein